MLRLRQRKKRQPRRSLRPKKQHSRHLKPRLVLRKSLTLPELRLKEQKMLKLHKQKTARRNSMKNLLVLSRWQINLKLLRRLLMTARVQKKRRQDLNLKLKQSQSRLMMLRKNLMNPRKIVKRSMRILLRLSKNLPLRSRSSQQKLQIPRKPKNLLKKKLKKLLPNYQEVRKILKKLLKRRRKQRKRKQNPKKSLLPSQLIKTVKLQLESQKLQVSQHQSQR